MLLNFSSPVFTALLAALWLKESLSRQTAVAVTLGLVGIALILKPSPSHFSITALVGLASAILAAVAMINIRDMSTTEPTLRIVLYFAITASLMSAVPLIWAWEPLTSRGLVAMAAAGTCASIGQVLLTHAYSSAPAAKVGTVNYSTIVFAGMFGWVFWQERPDLTAFLGASLVCLAGILVARRKSPKAA